MKKINYPKALTIKVSDEVHTRRKELSQELLRELIDKALKIEHCPTCNQKLKNKS